MKPLVVRCSLGAAALVAAALLGGWKLGAWHRTPLVRPAGLDDALLAAIRDGDSEGVQNLLQRGADVNARGEAGTTPLMQAALNADAAVMELLLAQRADPNVEDPNGATALLRAVHDLDKVKLLLYHGARVRDRDVVLASTVPGGAATVQFLLDHGGNANAQVGSFTALMGAATAGDQETLACLLEHGADVHRKAADGYTAVFGAVLSGNAALLEQLLERGADPNVVHEITNPTYDLMPAVTMAAWLGDAPVLKCLLAKGAAVNVQGGSFERTPLLCAATTGNEEVVRLLLAHGADVNAVDWAGRTPLDWAQRRGPTPIVRRLQQAGAKNAARPHKAEAAAARRQTGAARSVRQAVAPALPLLQRSGPQFIQKKGCISCHQQAAVALTVSAARARGLPVDEAIAAQERDAVLAELEGHRPQLLQGNGVDPALVGWTLWSFAAGGQEASPLTDAMVHFLVLNQKTDGHWKTPVNRPPHDAGPFTFTALAVLGLQQYAPKGRQREIQERIARARAWLEQTPAAETEDQTFRLLGLHWAGADAQAVREAAAPLRQQQRPDGGWAQLPSLASDAYASGEVLFALHEAGGLAATDPVSQRGVAFLLRAQEADGSWFVPSRSFPLIESFHSGFPHGRAQFISAAATCWACLALMQTLPAKGASPAKGSY